MKIAEVITNREYCNTKNMHKYREEVINFKTNGEASLCPHGNCFYGKDDLDECELPCMECINIDANKFEMRFNIEEEDE